jgi:hypothetical protein
MSHIKISGTVVAPTAQICASAILFDCGKLNKYGVEVSFSGCTLRLVEISQVSQKLKRQHMQDTCERTRREQSLRFYYWRTENKRDLSPWDLHFVCVCVCGCVCVCVCACARARVRAPGMPSVVGPKLVHFSLVCYNGWRRTQKKLQPASAHQSFSMSNLRESECSK